jgi:type IV pilus assembly protein PilE
MGISSVRRPSVVAGFTLIELLIAMVILAIIGGISIGSYRQYIRRANRVDATAALLRITTMQERHYLQNGRYASTAAELAAPPPAGLGIADTERGYYDLALAPAAGGAVAGYTATATSRAGGRQADDEECRTFSVDQRGQRGAETAGGARGPEITDRCWR